MSDPRPPTEREKMIAGEMYDPFDTELVAGRERARDLCQALNRAKRSGSDAGGQGHRGR